MTLSSLAGKRGYRLALFLSIALALPALGLGFFGDDYWHLMGIEGGNDLTTPMDLFAFGPGNPDAAIAHIKTGPYPWFIDPEFKAHFFRPFSCLLMTLDDTLFGHFAPAYHFHTLFWHFLLALGAMLILRRSLPPGIGALALILFVVDEAHAFPVSWWSNRNAVVAVAFGFLGVAAHLRWREDGWRAGMPLSLLAYLFALLSAEIGLCTLAYIPAYECFAAPGTLKKRAAALLPATALAVAYFLFYRASGYGAAYSDIYVDPGADPLGYLAVAPFRFAELMGAQFFGLPCEMALLRNGIEPIFIALGAIGLAVVGLALWKIWPRLDDAEKRALRWLIPGAVLSTAPSLAAIVSSRTLLAASLGGAAVIAAIIVHVRRAVTENGAWKPARWLRALTLLFIAIHLVVAPLSWPLQTIALRSISTRLNAILCNAEVDDSKIAQQQIILVNSPDPFTGMYLRMNRFFHGKPLPRSAWTLSVAPFEHRLTRTGDREMELEILDGQMFTGAFECLFRSAQRPMKPGYSMDLDGMKVTVLEVGDLGPKRLRLEFAEAPESDRYEFLTYRGGTYRRLTPPPLGETAELPFYPIKIAGD